MRPARRINSVSCVYVQNVCKCLCVGAVCVRARHRSWRLASLYFIYLLEASLAMEASLASLAICASLYVAVLVCASNVCASNLCACNVCARFRG